MNMEVFISITLKLAAIGILFLLIVATGIWLTRTGKPYNPVLFNVHKVISLAGVVITGIVVYNMLVGIETIPVMWVLVIATGVFFIALLVTGGLLNLDKPFYNLFRTIHRVLSALSIVLNILIFYIIMDK
jgi:hypothetical protein